MVTVLKWMTVESLSLTPETNVFKCVSIILQFKTLAANT